MPVKEDVRSEILKASIDLMNEGGIGALSMREVARRAGVSHQAPYHYFNDREAILAEIAGRGFDQLYDYMVSALGQARDKASRVQLMGEAYVRFALNHPEVFRLMFRCEMVDLSRYPDAKAKADRAFEALVAAMDATGTSADKGSPDLAPIIAAWYMAHGLATLLLEGKIGEQLGDTRDQKEAASRRILEVFSRNFGR
jgi:AcrR family transcriptional regulator